MRNKKAFFRSNIKLDLKGWKAASKRGSKLIRRKAYSSTTWTLL